MPRHILVIEDETLVSDLLSDALTAQGYTVAVADDGVKAESFCRAHLPDLVITDIFMANQDGIKTIMVLRKTHPHLPIVAISGGGHAFDPEMFLRTAEKLGAVRSFRKPFELKEVLNAVDALLAKKKYPEQAP